MEVLVIVYRQWEVSGPEAGFVKEISKKAKTLVTHCFQSAMNVVREQAYQLIAILTDGEAFPTPWRLDGLAFRNPTVILTQVNWSHILMLNTWIESLPALPSPKSRNNPVFLESLQYIDENLCESDLSLDKVASHVFISKCHYSRLFHKNAGIGFKEYVMRKRIEQAKLLLMKGEPVTDVCYSVGYSDLTHFARVFKKLVGINPSLFKQSKKTAMSG